MKTQPDNATMYCPRRTKRSGSLRLRGRTFWVRWKYRGNVFERSTGISIDEKNAVARATRKMDEITAPYRLTSELEFQTFVSMRVKTLAQAVREAHVKTDALTMKEVYDAFCKSPRRRTMKESTLRQYKAVTNALCSSFGNGTLMNDVTQAVAEKYAAEISLSYASQTFNNHIAKIGYIWDVLSTQNGTTANPWSGIVYKKYDAQERAVLTDEEIGRILNVAKYVYDGEGRLLVLVGKNTGMRIGDCTQLKWEDIDLENGMIRALTQKTGKKVAVPLLHELREQLESRPRKGVFVMPHMAHNSDQASRVMTRCFKRADIETSIVREKGHRARPIRTFHSLRANFITMCAEAGVDLEIVKAVVGHTTRGMTEHYAHIREKAVKEAFAKAGVT